MSEVESAVIEPKPKAVKSATRKDGKPKAKPGRKPRPPFMDLSVQKDTPKTESGDETVFGWPVKDGFSKIMLFQLPGEGAKFYATSWIIGDHKPVVLYKGVMHVVPNAVVNNILDANKNTMPEDEIIDDRFVVRRMDAPYIPFPHSDPIPATKEEFIAYRLSQEIKPKIKDLKMRRQP